MRPECSTMHNGSDLTVLEERERDEGFFWDKAGVKNLPRLRAKKAPVFRMCPCGEIFEFEEKILPYLGNCEVVDLYVLHYFIQKSVSHGFKISKCVILE